jgi:hypothetical protein
MKFSKLNKIILGLAVALSASQVAATTQTANFTFQTLPAVSIVETQAMNFGAVLALTSAAACTMELDAVNYISGTVDGTGALTGSSATAGANEEGFTAGCSAAAVAAGANAGTAGLYTITGAEGSTVTVTLTTDDNTGGGIDFQPIGYVGDFGTSLRDNVTGPAATSPGAGTGVPIQLPASGDANPDVTAGEVVLVLGGTITNQRALTPSEALTATFTVDVNY